jgi:EAL domain-containing protein (putative c-di-GMP-specific phosphodiesterase class I)
MISPAMNRTTDGVRLLSPRPSVLSKLERSAAAPDAMGEGVVLTGPTWEVRLKALLGGLSMAERASLYAVRLDDRLGLPLPADRLLERTRTDWFPEFLSHGLMTPHFQPIVELADGRVYGREALMRGRLGATEVRGAELVAAAEAHDALFSFDARARAAALEVGLPLLPEGEILFVNLDPRVVVDVEGSLRTTWPIAERMGVEPGRLGLELISPERCPDPALVADVVRAHRGRGALVALDDLSGGAESLVCLETLRPDVAKIDRILTAGIERSAGRRRLVAALVEVAHEQGCRVVAEGIERDSEFEVMRDLGVDLGQGFYFGQPTARPMAVDPRLVRARPELV